jgi:hypothetical protein
VAFVAVFPGHFTVAEDDLAMAFVAAEIFFENDRVVEARCFSRYQILLRVTMGAAADLRIMFALLKMANKTRRLRDSDVLSLDDLRVAARAAEFLSPFEVLKMDLVVEDDLLELHLALEKPLFVASRTQAAFIGDLCPGLGFKVKLGPVAAYLKKSFHLGSEKRSHSRGIMAHAAFHMAVGGRLPALVVRFHVVACAAESGLGRVFCGPYK